MTQKHREEECMQQPRKEAIEKSILREEEVITIPEEPEETLIFQKQTQKDQSYNYLISKLAKNHPTTKIRQLRNQNSTETMQNTTKY